MNKNIKMEHLKTPKRFQKMSVNRQNRLIVRDRILMLILNKGQRVMDMSHIKTNLTTSCQKTCEQLSIKHKESTKEPVKANSTTSSRN